MAHTLTDLPLEILHQICGHICLHCRNREGDAIFPCFDNEQGRRNKNTLAQLARTSKRLNQVAQPVLFHYFVVYSTFTVSAKRARAQVLAFLRIICQQPDLADEVRAVSLIPPAVYSDWYPIDHPTWRVISKLEPVIEGFPQDTLANGRPNFRKPARRSLAAITPWILAALPKLQRLTMEVPTLSFDEFKHLKPNASLRNLELIRSPGRIFLMVDIRNIFQYAPRVQILHAVDMSILCHHHYGRGTDYGAPRACNHTPWEELLPPTLRRISMSHVQVFRLAHLFDNCPQLQDLEILLTYNSQWDWSTIAPPNGACEGVRRTLRRLVVSYEDSYYWIETPDGLDIRTGVEGVYYNANMGFRNFESLEILEVEQLFLHADLKRLSPQSLHGLSQVLPQRLRVLHIGYVVSWTHLQPQLLDLASQKRAGNLPHLAIVRIDPRSEIGQESLKLVGDAMGDAGISFSVGQNPRGSSTRRLLPACPKKALAIQRTSFPLEDYGA